jgi:hypothetical protein
VALISLLGMIGFALDLSMVYNRKVELQTLADAAALAAAGQLNGTAAGVTNAVTATNTVVASLYYQYGTGSFDWNGASLPDGVLSFSKTSGESGDWVSPAAAGTNAAAAGLLYAKVDTSKLDGGYGVVNTVFIRALSSAFASLTITARAVAGRAATNVLPLAVCAQSATAAEKRANVTGNTAYDELVEYGFRRGVGYDLMQLNPGAATPENFLIDPLAPPGVTGAAADFATDVVGPFVCTGSMPMASVLGGAITVRRGFPLGELYTRLNSRFDHYDGGCTPEGAPPDANIKSYDYTAISWMSTAPGAQGAASWTNSGTRLWTRADPLPAPTDNLAAMYGPLWAYGRAVPYVTYQASPTEPTTGYVPFTTNAWAKLYLPGPPGATGYPTTQTTSTPYSSTSGSTVFLAPSTDHQPGVRQRRVLNVALLACPVAAGGTASATVLAVGKFFMTVPATSSALHTEFGGLVAPSGLGGAVELQR